MNRLDQMSLSKPPRPNDQNDPHTAEQQRQHWSDYRKELREGATSQFQAYSKYLLTLAAGALALSITLVKDIANPPALATPFLFASWAGFIVCIVAILSSLLIGYWRHIDFMMIMGENIRRRATYSKIVEDATKAAMPRVFLALHLVSAAGFVVGVVFLCVFAAKNI